jgi:hypothetical protein
MLAQEKQDLLDALNESLVFAVKLVPAGEKQLNRVDFSSLRTYINNAQEITIKLETGL